MGRFTPTIERVTEHVRTSGTRQVWLRRVIPYKWDDPKEIPTTFLMFWHLMYGHPMRGYQADSLNQIFPAIYGQEDISFKMARQAGKTVPVALLLGHQVVVESWPLVLMSSKEEKTRKIARSILRAMRVSGRNMVVDGVKEARFDAIGGIEPGFVCMSGKPLSEREGETAKLVLADESQDILHEAVWPDISPMLLSTGGVVLAMGIGGVQDSLIETIRQPKETLKLDFPWTDVVRRWGVLDGKSEQYERRVLKDKRIMRPEIFGAHYECQALPEGQAALYKHIIPWSEAYPGVPFDPLKYFTDLDARFTRLRIGIDWGKRQDFSCALLVGSGGRSVGREIVICGYNKWEGMDYDHQADSILEWLDREPPYDVPYDAVQPEMNGVGEAATDGFKRVLRNAKLRQCCKPVNMDDLAKLEEAEKLGQAAQSKRLIFVDEEADPEGKLESLNLKYAAEVAANLRSVGIKYTSSARGTLKTNYTHSDWNSALFAAMRDPEEAFI